jgi:hypothetical protein
LGFWARFLFVHVPHYSRGVHWHFCTFPRELKIIWGLVAVFNLTFLRSCLVPFLGNLLIEFSLTKAHPTLGYYSSWAFWFKQLHVRVDIAVLCQSLFVLDKASLWPSSWERSWSLTYLLTYLITLLLSCWSVLQEAHDYCYWNFEIIILIVIVIWLVIILRGGWSYIVRASSIFHEGVLHNCL